MLSRVSKGGASPANWARNMPGPLRVFMAFRLLSGDQPPMDHRTGGGADRSAHGKSRFEFMDGRQIQVFEPSDHQLHRLAAHLQPGLAYGGQRRLEGFGEDDVV